jgi:hypothetical protein
MLPATLRLRQRLLAVGRGMGSKVGHPRPGPPPPPPCRPGSPPPPADRPWTLPEGGSWSIRPIKCRLAIHPPPNLRSPRCRSAAPRTRKSPVLVLGIERRSSQALDPSVQRRCGAHPISLSAESDIPTRSRPLCRTPPGGPLGPELAVGSSKRFRPVRAPWRRCRNPD